MTDPAALSAENEQLREALAAAERERDQLRKRQLATAEVLRVIASAPSDRDHVLQQIASVAGELFESPDIAIWQRQHETIQVIASSRPNGPVGAVVPLVRDGSAAALAMLDGHVTQRAFRADPQAPFRHVAAAPLRRGEAVVGAIAVPRFGREAQPSDVRPFTEDEITLLETFADQAVIAMENARLFNELEQRNKDLADSLEQQTATAEVLQAISSSPTDSANALQLVAGAAQHFAGVESIGIYRERSGKLIWVGQVGALGAQGNPSVDHSGFPIDRTSVNGRAFLDKRTICLDDLPAAIAEYPGAQTLGVAVGVRSILVVPLLHHGQALGTLAATRGELRPFSSHEVALLETFANQAAIAIANEQLFRELEEALDQQTAVAGVLQAISRSAFDLQPVLDTLVESAGRLLDSPFSSLAAIQAGGMRWVAARRNGGLGGVTWADPGPVLGLGRSFIAEALTTKRTLSVHGGVAGIAEPYPHSAELWQRDADAGTPIGSAVVVPLLSGEEVAGLLMVRRPAEESYSAEQEALLEVFANQAVIAIQNSQLLEELRDANGQLRAANAAKSQFLSTMSHELRTPLNAVIGYSELLREEAEDDGLKSMVPDLMRVNAAGKHLLSLINNVLDISKIEAGKMELELQDFAVAEVLAEVGAVVPPLMSQNSNGFVLDAADDLGAMHADKTKLRQCLLNLLSNAAKFTEQGIVTLAVRRDRSDVGDQLSFTVTDTGIGMTEEQVGRLFTAFTQAEAGTASRYGGTGLGLSLSRQFARLMGGDITVRSELGKGSTFTLTVPAEVGPPAPAAAPQHD